MLTMRILGLTVENFKRLSVVQITPEGRVVQITGANEQGKTSVLDAIAACLDGLDSVPAQPIRKGQKRGFIKTILGPDGEPRLIVERRFTEKGSSLHVTSPEGLKYPHPQAVLDELVGALTFDPMEFMGMKPTGQFETIRRLVKIDADLDALDAERLTLYNIRTDMNRRLRDETAQANAIVVPELPEAPPDREAVMRRLMDVDNFNATVRQKQYQRQAFREQLDTHTTLLARAQDSLLETKRRHAVELERAEKYMDDCIAARDATEMLLNEKVAADTEPLHDPAEIKAELDAADRVLAGFELKRRKEAHDAAVKNYTADAAARTARIDAIDVEKATAIANAKMPIAGLSFADGVVLFQGVPLDQASGAQKLRVSAAIGAALNPRLRVMLARDATNLDSKSMRLLAEFAEEKDFQIWCERVDESGAVGVVIEDGHVKGQEALVEEQKRLALGDAP
jgi:hypothetical protein